MSKVSDWAQREAKRHANGDVYGDIVPAFRQGALHVADLLLSDRAVEAAAKAHAFSRDGVYTNAAMRAALQAALDAITEVDE